MVDGVTWKNCIAWKVTNYHSFQSVLQQDQVHWSNLSWEASVSDIPQHSLKSCSHWLSIVCLHLSKNYDVQNFIKYRKRWKKVILICSMQVLPHVLPNMHTPNHVYFVCLVVYFSEMCLSKIKKKLLFWFIFFSVHWFSVYCFTAGPFCVHLF